MTPRQLLGLSLLATLAATPLVAQGPPPKPEPLSAADSTRLMGLGHRYMGWLLAGRVDSLVGVMTADFVESGGGAAAVAERLGILAERGGQETGGVAERMTRRNGKPQFWHEGNFALFDAEPLVIRFLFDGNGKISGMGMGPKSQAPFDQ